MEGWCKNEHIQRKFRLSNGLSVNPSISSICMGLIGSITVFDTLT